VAESWFSQPPWKATTRIRQAKLQTRNPSTTPQHMNVMGLSKLRFILDGQKISHKNSLLVAFPAALLRRVTQQEKKKRQLRQRE
jgi:hypothetical protein